ncbi:MAG: hypothetical protein AAFP76_12120 [Bacteroidota bacterium]
MDDPQYEIERYLDGSLTSAEKAAFEARLSEDSVLAQEYEIALATRGLISEAGRLDLKETLEGFETEMETEADPLGTESTTQVFPLWAKRLLPIAAMVVIFLGVYQYVIGGSISSSEVYDTYFETYASPSELRDVNDNELVNWEKASQLYASGAFQEALGYFSKAKGEVPDYLSEYYKGICHLSVEAPYYQLAINAFDEVLKTDNDYNQQAQWYKALALIQTERREEAFVLLNLIVENESYNHIWAAEILETKIKD